MKYLLLILQILAGIGLISTILIQTSKGGLGSAFGGGGEFHTKRGAEKLIFKGTILLAVIFFILSILNLLVK